MVLKCTVVATSNSIVKSSASIKRFYLIGTTSHGVVTSIIMNVLTRLDLSPKYLFIRHGYNLQTCPPTPNEVVIFKGGIWISEKGTVKPIDVSNGQSKGTTDHMSMSQVNSVAV